MKNVLLIDMVEFPAERASHPLGSVETWFTRHACEDLDVAWKAVGASSPELSGAAEAADGIIISGSPRDAWSDEPEVRRLLDFARWLIDGRQPILGVCFGHQLLGRALGAEVKQNPAGWEVGARDVSLTKAGSDCPLFAGFPAVFQAIESHRDAVLTLPEGADLLASNSHTEIQAFGVENRVFGVQFHPEMDGEILRYLWTDRREKLRQSVDFDLDAVLDSAEADASCVLRNFIATLS